MIDRVHKTREFVFWAFLLSWSLGGLLYLLGGARSPILATLFGILFMFGPLAAAVIVQKRRNEPVLEPLGIRWHLNGWWGAAWVLPVLIAWGTVGLSVLVPGIALDWSLSAFMERFASTLPPETADALRQQVEQLPVHPVWLVLGQGMVAGVTVNAVAALGEEAGWRGLLQRELAPMGFWTSSAVIGIVWGTWHAPLILQGHNYPNHPTAGVFMMILFTVALSPIMSYVRLRARSVLAAAVLHGTFNGVTGLALMVVAGGSDLLVGVTGITGIVCLSLLSLCLFVHDRYLASTSIARILRQEAGLLDRPTVTTWEQEIEADG